MVRRHVESFSSIPCDKNADLSGKRENGHSADYCTYAGKIPTGIAEWYGTLYSRGRPARGSIRIRNLVVDFGRFTALSEKVWLPYSRRREERIKWQPLPHTAISLKRDMFVRKNVQIVKVKELKRFFGKIIDFIGFKFLSLYLESAIIHVHGQRIKGNNLF